MLNTVKKVLIAFLLFICGIAGATAAITLIFFEPTRFDYLFIYALSGGGAGSFLKTIFTVIPIITGLVFAVIALYTGRKGRWVLFLTTTSLFVYAFRICDYISGTNAITDIFDKEYISPQNFKLKFPQSKRNLIVLYLESIESDYANPKISASNLLPNLSKLAEENYTFSGYHQLLYTGTTLSAQFAGMCGAPYKTEIKIQSLYDSLNYTIPNVICYPEVLRQNNYNTYFIQSGSLDFAYTRQLINQHGFPYAEGYDELIAATDNASVITGNDWGIRDRELYRLAQQKIEKLANQHKPFLITIATIDTHEPTTFLDPKCTSQYGDKRDVIVCADQMAADFIRWIQKQDFYPQTTIVVLGDHTVIGRNSVYPNHQDRKIFNMIINPVPGFASQPHRWTTLDVAPTILEALGIENQGWGLGRSLGQKEPTMIEKYGNVLDMEFNKNSDFYKKMHSVNPQPLADAAVYSLSAVISQNSNLKKYTRAKHEVLDTIWTDDLRFKLETIPKHDICLDVEFLVIFEPSAKNSSIEVFLDQVSLAKWEILLQQKMPIHKSVCFSPKMIKDDKILHFRFRRNNKIDRNYYISIGLKKFFLTEFTTYRNESEDSPRSTCD